MDKQEKAELRDMVMTRLDASQSPFAPRDGYLVPPEDWPDMKRYLDSIGEMGLAWKGDGDGNRWRD